MFIGLLKRTKAGCVNMFLLFVRYTACLDSFPDVMLWAGVGFNPTFCTGLAGKYHVKLSFTQNHSTPPLSFKLYGIRPWRLFFNKTFCSKVKVGSRKCILKETLHSIYQTIMVPKCSLNLQQLEKKPGGKTMTTLQLKVLFT